MTAPPAVPQTDRHPDLDLEQSYVTRSYQLFDKGLADVEHTYESYREGNRATATALRRALDILRNSRGSGQLVFGRVDRDGEPLYIGRRRVHDESKNLVVASWHAPAAQVFYEATPEDPLDLELKRVFVEQDRILSRVVDEITAASVRDVPCRSGRSAIQHGTPTGGCPTNALSPGRRWRKLGRLSVPTSSGSSEPRLPSTTAGCWSASGTTGPSAESAA